MACTFTSTASASAILYTATDLADTTAGQDLWRYDYVLSGFKFAPNQGFSVLFDYKTYELLSDPTPDTDSAPALSTDADWDVLLLQPEPGLLADGLFDSLALQSPSSFVFSTHFVWMGSGTPGSQPFVIYDENFEDIARGRTAPTSIPEPGTLLLLASGVGLAARQLRKR
jgi:hypothetical protein